MRLQDFNTVRAVVRVAAVVAISFVLTACSTGRTGRDFDPWARFSDLRTFSWMQREHHDVANPQVTQHAKEAIEAELKAKGYTQVPDGAVNADFLVDFTLGSQDRVDIRSFPATYQGPWFWDAPFWGYPYWGKQVDARRYREGTLSIDIFDTRNHRPVWHGWAKKELSRSDREYAQAPIRAAVTAILKAFPPKDSSPR